MSVPGSSALFNPTSFPRVDRIPFDVDQSNGVPTDFGGDPFNVGGQSTLYDNAKDSNTGFPAVNRPLTYTFLVDSSWTRVTDPYYHESLVFISNPRRLNPSFTGNMPPRSKMLSLSAWNRYMREPQQRRDFGKDQHVANFKVIWRFMGSVKRPHRPLIPDDAVPVVFAGRSRVLDLGRAYTPSGTTGKTGDKERLLRGIPGQLDCMFLIYRRYKYKDLLAAELMEQDNGVSNAQKAGLLSGVSDTDDTAYTWQAEIYVNRTGQTPNAAMLAVEDCVDEKDNFVGDYERLGWIGFVYGDRNFCMESAERARKIVKGKPGYEQETPLLEAVELFMGTR
jgi:hypothetical protein